MRAWVFGLERNVIGATVQLGVATIDALIAAVAFLVGSAAGCRVPLGIDLDCIGSSPKSEY